MLSTQILKDKYLIAKVTVGWMLALALFHPDVSAQFKNVKIDELSFHNQLTQPTIAIIGKDAGELVATGFDDAFYSSKDKGTTWEKSKLESSAMSQEHVMIADPKGTLYMIQTVLKGKDGKRQVVCMISKDGGKIWEEAVEVGKNEAKDQCYPAATLDTKGNVIVTWSQLDKYGDADSTCQSLIYVSSSATGKKWSKPVQLAQTPGDCLNDKQTAVGSVAAVGPDGKMFVSWYGQEKMHMDRSFGNGMWLENDILIANQPAGWKSKIPGHALVTGLPKMAVDQSKGTYHGCLYLSWADQRNGEKDSDVWFMRSNNHGDYWSTPLKLGVVSAGKHQYAPTMTLDQSNGFIYILFYDRSAHDDNQTDISLAYSSDSGANFKSVKVNESSFLPDDQSNAGSYLAISAHNGIIVPVWSSIDNGVTSLWTTTITQEELIKPVAAKGKKKK